MWKTLHLPSTTSPRVDKAPWRPRQTLRHITQNNSHEVPHHVRHSQTVPFETSITAASCSEGHESHKSYDQKANRDDEAKCVPKITANITNMLQNKPSPALLEKNTSPAQAKAHCMHQFKKWHRRTAPLRANKWTNNIWQGVHISCANG